MKKREEEPQEDFDFEIDFRPRESEMVSIKMPKDVVKSLKKVAIKRDMSFEALLKFYIGQGLRQDISRLFGDSVLEATEQVLSRHIESEEEVASILREIRNEAIR
ncbi:MAG: hypothetical protein L0177_19190 [Chloroflexi bacterium]|nr:hypothetical protein [Chloroflexota bacterium]